MDPKKVRPKHWRYRVATGAMVLTCLGASVAAARTVYFCAQDGWDIRGYTITSDYAFFAWVPGFRFISEFEGSLMAIRDHAEKGPYFLGAGQRGRLLLGVDECEVLQGPSREWLLGLLEAEKVVPNQLPEPSGTAEIRCLRSDSTKVEFYATVLEVGCIIDLPLDSFATGYNRRMAGLALDGQRAP